MILQCIRIIVGNAGFEPGTSASEVWCATNEPPHLLNLDKLTQYSQTKPEKLNAISWW